MSINKFHHVAYRCRDAARTVDFYTRALGLPFVMAMSEEKVPTTGAHCPYMHIFFKLADGSHLAFFDLSEEPEMQLDPNTPPWVQHIAMEVAGAEALDEHIALLQDYGVEVIGPIDHAIFKSVYFHDPDGHRLELTYRTETSGALQKLGDVAWSMLEEWNQTRRVSAQAAWVHEGLHD
jgi:glyoxylase I family protein